MKWWQSKVWDGYRISGNHPLTPVLREQAEDLPPDLGWYKYAVPTTRQTAYTCVGDAWANWLEMMIRRYIGDVIPQGMQIDGTAIWTESRNHDYNGNMAGGLYLEQGFYAAQRLGILPPDATLETLAPDREDICAALLTTPIVQGQIVAPGMLETNPENGGVDESKPPAPSAYAAGHATVLMANAVQNGRMFYTAQGTWGQQYGYKGYFTMSERFWQLCYPGDLLMTANMPCGWTQYQGWIKYLVPTTEFDESSQYNPE